VPGAPVPGGLVPTFGSRGSVTCPFELRITSAATAPPPIANTAAASTTSHTDLRAAGRVTAPEGSGPTAGRDGAAAPMRVLLTGAQAIRAARISSALAKRRAGSFSSAREMSASRAGEMARSGRRWRGGMGICDRWAVKNPTGVSDWKGSAPVQS
jgi:hypothetical protein